MVPDLGVMPVMSGSDIRVAPVSGIEFMDKDISTFASIPQVTAIHEALTFDRLPRDIAALIRTHLDAFRDNPGLFGSIHLQGPLKRAELIVKLGFWLVVGRLTAHEFRLWTDCIPAEENGDWDVDFFCPEPEEHTRTLLRLGPIITHPDACLVQAAWWNKHPF